MRTIIFENVNQIILLIFLNLLAPSSRAKNQKTKRKRKKKKATQFKCHHPLNPMPVILRGQL